MTKKSRRVAKARRVLFSISLVLVTMVVAVGGTIAWLQDSTTAVTNTFSKTNLDIELTETFNKDTNNDGTADKWEAAILPGSYYRKDPKVTVSSDSEESWLFVEVTLSEGLCFTYDVALDDEDSGWTPVETTDNYEGEGENRKKVSTTYVYGISATAGFEDYLLNTVHTVNGVGYEIYVDGEEVGKDDMPAGNVTMTFDACAIQKTNLTNAAGTAIGTVTEAWTYVKSLGLMAQ